MDICVCGAQVPFTQGGAELLMENLVAAFGAAGHRAELVRLPVAWEPERLFDAAVAWRLVPLDADVVVAVNFPSYFVHHPRKVVWLAHQHRGVYDGFGAPWSGMGYDDRSLEIQRQLIDWDNRALEEATARFTISGVVAERLRRFNGLDATPLYHPPPLDDRLVPGPYGDYMFCASRLADNKRPQLLIEGLAASTSGTRAVLAGAGPLREQLQADARRLGVADRLDMPGFVDDDTLVRYFASALAVVYAPYDEDYGYVTLQAFRAAKPVITAKDAGGVLEWVEDGVNGIVTDGTGAGIGEAIDRLAADPALARRMGEAGRDRLGDLSWGPVVETLLRGA
ncbi:MAG TPA: glycosyltransferase family 4 protein [Acidimicrobiales bacterium]|nr:glycosyltransferase family 4 protein [Acidimicrobiales bacterium]